MLNKKYQSALDYLSEANLWNRSPFMDKVIKVHLLICFYYLDNLEQSDIYADELYKYIFNNKIQDENIIRKVSLNLCIYYNGINKIDKAKECMELVYPYLKSSNCEYRGLALYNELMNAQETLEHLKHLSYFFKDMSFEPWLTTFSHE